MRTLEQIRAGLPKKPYCTDNLLNGLVICSLETALEKKYIQLNPPEMKTFMIFDVDYPGAAFAAGDANLPAPTFTVVNLKNGHAHLIYALESPVCVSKNGGPKPQRYLNAIETAFAFMLGADRRYSGLICKNPFNAHWDTFFSGADYSLSELADFADLSSLSRAYRGEGLEPLGRNCFRDKIFLTEGLCQ